MKYRSTLGLLLLNLGLISCGRNELIDVTKEPSPSGLQFPYVIEPDFQPYYDRFYSDIGLNPNNIPIKFNKLDKNIVGICYIYPDGKTRIEIDTDFWNRSSDLAIEQVIFHEIGHSFGLDHNDNRIEKDSFSMPESIMYPSAFGSSIYYELYHDYYMEELKKELKILE